MIDVLLKTIPFFAIVGLGYVAARTKFFPEIATQFLT
ncbi:MAG: AEC family transporter, partial [Planktomarina sp.]|nr:AEC family transporter [Planktomarina sp.]